MVNSLAIAVAVSGVCAAAATVTSSWEIYMHLTHYVQPQFQLHIVRILVMVPIYSVTSFLALFVSEYWGLLLDIVRDGYEAYVIYNFVVLLIEFSGGDRRLIYFLETRPRMHHPFPLRDRLPPIHLGAPFVFAVRAACLQFVFAKPAGSLFLLYITSHPDSLLAFRGAGGLVYLANNISVTVALYALVLFYHAAEELLRPYRPLPKFLAVKAVIFFSFWQGVALSVAIRLGALKDVGGYSAHEQATGLQDVLICVEMLAAAVCHAFVFPYTEHVAAVAAAAAPDGAAPPSATTSLYRSGRRGGGGRAGYGSLSAGSAGDVEAALGAAGGGKGRAARAKGGGGTHTPRCGTLATSSTCGTCSLTRRTGCTAAAAALSGSSATRSRSSRRLTRSWATTSRAAGRATAASTARATGGAAGGGFRGGRRSASRTWRSSRPVRSAAAPRSPRRRRARPRRRPRRPRACGRPPRWRWLPATVGGTRRRRRGGGGHGHLGGSGDVVVAGGSVSSVACSPRGLFPPCLFPSPPTGWPVRGAHVHSPLTTDWPDGASWFVFVSRCRRGLAVFLPCPSPPVPTVCPPSPPTN